MPGGHQGGVDGLPQGSADSDLVSVPSPLPVTKVSDPVEASSCPLQATDLGDLFKITAVQLALVARHLTCPGRRRSGGPSVAAKGAPAEKAGGAGFLALTT